MPEPRELDLSYLHQFYGANTLASPSLLGAFYRVPKRSVFVSYHHGLDRSWYQEFTGYFCEIYEVFEDTSPERAKDSDDTDYIMWSLRDNHIKGSSCTIVLCGQETDKLVKAHLDVRQRPGDVFLPVDRNVDPRGRASRVSRVIAREILGVRLARDKG